jgi:hypothetical protein
MKKIFPSDMGKRSTSHCVPISLATKALLFHHPMFTTHSQDHFQKMKPTAAYIKARDDLIALVQKINPKPPAPARSAK